MAGVLIAGALASSSRTLYLNCSTSGCKSEDVPVRTRHRNAAVSASWHGQVLQDCYAQHLLNSKRGGYYLDVAANDAIRYSNTVVLDRFFGWNGICIEPNPVYHEKLLTERTCTVVAAALSDVETDAIFEFRPPEQKGEMDSKVFGHLVKATEAGSSSATHVRTIRLSNLLRTFSSPPIIDFMSLDVEGAEALVMASFPWSTHTVSLLSIERTPSDLRKMLMAHHYLELCRLGTNMDTLWVHSTLLDSEHVMRVWPNARRQANGRTHCFSVLNGTRSTNLREWQCPAIPPLQHQQP